MTQWAGWMLCATAIGCAGSGPSVYSPDVEAEKARCNSVAHGTTEPIPIPIPPKFAGAQEVKADAVAAHRIAGEKTVFPDEETAADVQRNGVHRLVVAVKLCIDEGGVPRYANVLKSSCFPRYDAKVVSTMATWRYSPLLIGGVPTPVCTTVVFVYSVL